MTADDYPLDHAFLGRVANRVISECRDVNWVPYDIKSNPRGPIDWEQVNLCRLKTSFS